MSVDVMNEPLPASSLLVPTKLEKENVFHKNKSNHLKKKILASLVQKARQKESQTSEQENEETGEGYIEKDYSSSSGFTIIVKQPSSKFSSLNQYLPKWIAHPIVITTDLKNVRCPIEDIEDLDKTLVEKLLSNAISHFFPVQAEVIPWMLNDIKRFGLKMTYLRRPRDICVCAPTGSGKTLSFAIPIVQCLSKRVVPKIRALIVAPVQELVIQIANVFLQYCAGTNLRVLSAAGGRRPLHIEQKKLVKETEAGVQNYESLIDILVITPGRLVEHLENTKGFDLCHLRFLVLDEADRMLDNIQNEWLHRLEKHLRYGGFNDFLNSSGLVSSFRMSVPQKLLFSATLSQDPEKLKKINLFQPILFSTCSTKKNGIISDKSEDYIGSYITPLELKEKYIIVDPVSKPLVLCELISRGWRNILCFTKSAVTAHKLSILLSILNPTLKIAEISSMLLSGERDTIFKDFSKGSIDMLVCSDVMARGMDINCVKYVISYDPPKHIQSYIHRVGRTGRGGMKGTAVTLVSALQVPLFNQMLTDVNKNNVKQMVLNEDDLINFKPNYKIALQKLKQTLKDEQTKMVQQIKLEKLGPAALKRWKNMKKKRSKFKKSYL